MRSSPIRKALTYVVTFALTLLMLVPMAAIPVYAQATTGTLRGTVTDQTGGIIPNATVRVKNQQTNTENVPVQTSDAGIYTIPNLTPGKYTITVEQAGFSRAQITDVNVNIGQVTTYDIALTPGQVTETVTVTAGTDVEIQRDQAQISTTFQTRQVEDLPTNAAGGGLDTLLLNVPGVAQNSGGGTNTNGTGLSVNGNRGRSNNFQIDGSDNNDLSVGGPSLFVDNADQVQEYQIITNNFSAQYGRNLGAVVNIVTKGGTNDFHGTAFEYFRDQHNLDTLDNIERASGFEDPPRALSNVFGGTLGGPIKRNKAFFFFSYQGIRQPGQVFAESGSLAILPGDLTRLAANNPGNPLIQAIATSSAFAIPLGTVSPRASFGPATSTRCINAAGTTVTCGTAGAQGPFQLGGAFDVVNINGLWYQAAFPQRIFPQTYTQDEWSLRGDMKVTDRDNFYVRYLDQTSIFTNAGGSTSGYTYDLPADSKNFGGTYVRQMSSKMTNEFRAVWQKLALDFGGCSSLGGNASTPGCIPPSQDIESAQVEQIGFAAAAIPALLNKSAAYRTINGNVGLPQGRITSVYQFADNLTYTFGRHSFLMGAEYKYTSASVPFLPRYAGQFVYNTPASVTNNQPSQAIVAFGAPIVDYTEWDQYYFVQDDWKIRDNLTLNLGVRYEYTGQPINDLRDLQLARENDPTTAFFLPSLPLERRVQEQIPADKNNFAPRFGFAWTPRFGTGFLKKMLGEDQTVIRGGYAIAYDPAFYNILLNVGNTAPNVLLANVTGASAAALGIPSMAGADVRAKALAAGTLPLRVQDPQFLSRSFVAPDFHSPYSQQWSFGIQRQIGRNNVFEARYVGNRGIGLFQTVDVNPFVQTLVNGFTRTTQGQTIVYPSFANLLPPGTGFQTAATCPDNPATPTQNEATIAAGRLQCRGQETIRANTGRSWYDSLQIRYAGRFLNNSLSLTGAYTFSKTLDNTSEVFTFSTENSILAANPFNYLAAEKSLSNLNRPHIASFSFIYDVPWYKEQRGFLGHLLGGYQLNGNYVFNSGRPFTPGQSFNSLGFALGTSYMTTTGTDPIHPFFGNPNAPIGTVAINQVDAARLYGTTLTNPNGFLSLNAINESFSEVPVSPSDVRFIFNGPGAARVFGNPFGDVPRNYLRGPAINQLNLGFFKTTRIFENVRLQFRAELYNALNHPQPGFGVTRGSSVPDFQVENAGFTFLDQSQIELARRVVQFGLRLVF